MTAAPMRVFVSTGEASGEMLAADLLAAMRAQGVTIEADGIGGERLAAAGVNIVHRTSGWASLGPLDALGKIPKLYGIMVRTASWLRRAKYDLIVLVDFGAFNVRLAKTARLVGTTTPMLYYFPPAAWLDNERRARVIAGLGDALTAFVHQRDFYRGLHLPIGWVGHPLVSSIAPREPRAAPPDDGGTIALLPGSRASEISRHAPRLLEALALVRERRPNVTAIVAAADDAAAAEIDHLLRMRSPLPTTIVYSARDALRASDVAAAASGTVVLEAALLEVPTVGMYVLSDAQARIAKRVYSGRYVTLPNLVLDEPVVPELLQDAATPRALADALEGLLHDSASQINAFRRLRLALGPADALERAARFARELTGR